jgi:hypothetical protein
MNGKAHFFSYWVDECRVPLQARPPGYAIAISPTHGWQDYTADNNGLDFIARSHNQILG